MDEWPYLAGQHKELKHLRDNEDMCEKYPRKHRKVS